jgi:asparagine synthase (glutamine-hydrolysing)
MCGIAGIVDLRGSGPSMDDLALMLNALRHRGPDDVGSVKLGPAAIGMRRLSILDTSARGHQPMQSGECWIVFNGEIYNFLELAEELETLGTRFTSSSDTEVILAAYQVWGIDCVKRFNGIWAFGLWDNRTQELHLSRDRFGVKPLFLAQRGGKLAFASEIKALIELDWVSRSPEPGAISAFLRDGLTDHTDATFFAGIRRLAAATTLTIGASRAMENRYWGPSYLGTDSSVEASSQDQEHIEALRSLLIDAVALQLRSDVSLGSCLSGGIDSSSIVSIASGLRKNTLSAPGVRQRHREAQAQLAFFADFDEPGISERHYADIVAARTGVRLITTTPQPADLIDTINQIVKAQDEPFGSTSIVAQFFVMKAASEAGVKVLLDGQGADEILAGYPPYLAMRYGGALRTGGARSGCVVARMMAQGSIRPVQTMVYAALGTHPLPANLRRFRLPSSALGGALRNAYLAPAAPPAPTGTVLSSNLWRQVSSENLPALLRFEDRNSMAFGIEARVPFLDHRVVELALALPDRLKIDGTEQKAALRRSMDGIVPDAVIERRDKIAFRTPQTAWLQSSAAFLAGTTTPVAERHGLLRRGTVERLIRGFEAGKVRDDHLWRILSLELWLRWVARL